MVLIGDDKNVSAFKMTSLLLGSSTIIINTFSLHSGIFPYAIISGCAKLMFPSQILAHLPIRSPTTNWASCRGLWKSSVEWRTSGKPGSEMQCHPEPREHIHWRQRPQGHLWKQRLTLLRGLHQKTAALSLLAGYQEHTHSAHTLTRAQRKGEPQAYPECGCKFCSIKPWTLQHAKQLCQHTWHRREQCFSSTLLFESFTLHFPNPVVLSDH